MSVEVHSHHCPCSCSFQLPFAAARAPSLFPLLQSVAALATRVCHLCSFCHEESARQRKLSKSHIFASPHANGPFHDKSRPETSQRLRKRPHCSRASTMRTERHLAQRLCSGLLLLASSGELSGRFLSLTFQLLCCRAQVKLLVHFSFRTVCICCGSARLV